MCFEIDVWWERKISFSNSFGESLGTFEEILLPVTLRNNKSIENDFRLYSNVSTNILFV